MNTIIVYKPGEEPVSESFEGTDILEDLMKRLVDNDEKPAILEVHRGDEDTTMVDLYANGLLLSVEAYTQIKGYLLMHLEIEAAKKLQPMNASVKLQGKNVAGFITFLRGLIAEEGKLVSPMEAILGGLERLAEWE